MTKAERNHLASVAERGCCICGMPSEVHHIREFGEKRNHFKTIPLGPYHHRGAAGIHHMGKRAWRRKYGHETNYLQGGRDGE